MRRIFYLPILFVPAVLVYFGLAQAAPQALPAIFPAGALVYLEARDFKALLGDWDSSAEKGAWLESANYEAFSRSRLFLKLGDAQKEFAEAAGVPADYALVGSVAGGNSALGIYGIGDLQFLYATHLPAARAMNSDLWKSRGKYQTRRAGGVDYYVKEDPATHRVAAFAVAGDVLLLATKEELISGALELIARQGRPSLASEKWVQDSTGAAQSGPRDLRMVYNMTRLIATPHFRSYWVQRNTSELREFSAGLADLEKSRGEVRESRVMLRVNPAAAVADEGAAGQALAAVPDDAGFYRAWLRPDANRAAGLIEEKLFAAGARVAPESKLAPTVANSAEAGSEADLETRIDQAPLVDDREAMAFRELRDRLAATPLLAMVDVESGRADQVFVGTDAAVVLVARDRWDEGAMRKALSQAAGALWTTAGIGAGWRGNALDGLGKLAMAVDGSWLVVGNSADLVNRIFARRGRPAAAGVAYAAGWRHARELGNFLAMSRLIDFPQIPPAPEGTQAREPMFFSENLASLGGVLRRVESAQIAMHDTGAMVREAIVYRIAP